jgi:hypothetical protein
MNTKINQSDIEWLNPDSEPSVLGISNSINLRIKKHKVHIERDRKLIVDNLSHMNIVSDAHERIKLRLAKIEEAQEILTLFGVDKKY